MVELEAPPPQAARNTVAERGARLMIVVSSGMVPSYDSLARGLDGLEWLPAIVLLLLELLGRRFRPTATGLLVAPSPAGQSRRPEALPIFSPARARSRTTDIG
jgi:hypothetical protein